MSAIVLISNIPSLRAQRRLDGHTQRLAQSSERMSSGLRINHAKDDAAGFSLNAGARVFSQGEFERRREHAGAHVLRQASVAVLAQANRTPEIVLQLLSI